MFILHLGKVTESYALVGKCITSFWKLIIINKKIDSCAIYILHAVTESGLNWTESLLDQIIIS